MNCYTKRNKILLSLVFYFLIFSTLQLSGMVKLPRLISNGMVLQRDTEVKLWGWADEGEIILITFLDSLYQVTGDSNGSWELTMNDLKAGGPYSMTVIGRNNIVIRDIYVGDVWVSSGQSNMDLTINRVSPRYPGLIENSANRNIRYFQVPRTYNFAGSQADVSDGRWLAASPDNIGEFSAVSYFFASELYEKYKIPIGVINASLGGSPAEAWLSEDALKKFPHYYKVYEQYRDTAFVDSIINADKKRISSWYSLAWKRDKGYENPDMPWYSPELDISDWKSIDIPGLWNNDEIGAENGVVWFRKDIDVPESMIGIPAKLILGAIIDADSVYVNGIFVGNTTYMYPPRRYDIPSGILKAGKNTIVIRVICNSGQGGFVEDKEYALKTSDESISLEGSWHWKLGTAMEPLRGETFIRWKPGGLYNAMIAPLINYAMKGVIWYQGESNTGRAEEYKKLFPAVIKNWREKWNRGNFPFLFVQLANYMEAKKEPSESGWAELREAQLESLSVPNTAMVVAIDIGEWNDIHPLNKKDIGKRLALAARKIAYGEDNIVYSGPIFKSARTRGHSIVLTFTNIGSGLEVKGDELNGFAIAGPDKKFVWANAKIENDEVIVWNDKIFNPEYVRYAWADNPSRANLYNKEGLPASPFRTDQ